VTRLFNKLLNIQPDELPRFFYLYAMFFLGLTGFIWGDMIVTAAFLQQVGVRFLPFAIIINAVVSILLIIVYTAFADRIANDTLMIALLGFSGVGIALGLVALQRQQVGLAYPLLYMVIRVPLQNIFNVHWATYVNGYYDTRAAKRIVPVLSSGVKIASIVAGATIPLLNRLLPAEGIIGIWLGAVVVMGVMVWAMPIFLREPRHRGGVEDSQLAPFGLGQDKESRSHLRQTLDNTREGYRYVTQSSFLRWLACATLVVMVLLAFIDYETGRIMVESLETTQAISNFTGLLNVISNIIVLPLQMVFLSRMIGWLGLGNASMLFPFSTLITSVGLLAVPGIGAATLGHLNRSTFRTLFYNPVHTLLYNAVPLRIKGRARAFIGGLVVPIGSLLGGLLLLLPQYVPLLPRWIFPALIGALTLAYLAGTWATRRHYAQALIKMLEQEDFSFLLSQDASELRVSDPSILEGLGQKLQTSNSHEFTAFMAKLLTQVGGSQALPLLTETVRSSPDPRTRAAILDVLFASELRGDSVRQLYADFLDDEDGRVRQSAVAGLAYVTSRDDREFQARLADKVNDPDTAVRVQALSAIIQSGALSQSEAAMSVLEQLLAAEEGRSRAEGVRLLGEIGDVGALQRVLGYLSDRADRVRLEAMRAIENRTAGRTLGDERNREIEAQVLPLLNDPVERLRQAAVTVLGQVGSRACYEPLIDVLTDPSSQVRAQVVDTLAKKGKSVIPAMHDKLKSTDSEMRKMAMVVLSRINPKEYSPLVVGEIVHGNLLSIYRHRGQAEALTELNRFATIAVLQTAVRERSLQLTDEIFYFLSAVHDPGAIHIIQESLRSSSALSRANATEALESLTSPQTARLIAPLFEPEVGAEQLLAVSQDTWEITKPTSRQALHDLGNPTADPWFRALTVASLGDLAMALAPAPLTVETKAVAGSGSPGELVAQVADSPAATPKRRQRRSPPGDLFGALLGEPTTTVPASEPVQSISPPLPVTDSLPALPFTWTEVEALIAAACQDSATTVRDVAQAADRRLKNRGGAAVQKETVMLSTIEKIIFLKEVPFFQGMTIDQLRVLANVCEERMFDEDTTVYSAGDAGGILYVVVNGRVGLEQEKRTGSARLATIDAYSYFGEQNLFDNSPRTTSAVAIQDTLTLQLRREPLIALARQHPDLSLELINVLSERLREANDRIAELTRTRPRELHKLFDLFE
jgi:CRP/FNR family transcriptional regulator, cyclic AMP receptor protein